MLASGALRIRVGHSPDPDDAFMYWALTTDLVDTRGHVFEQVLGDIQTLNQWARCGRLEVTAISLAAYPFVQEDYALLPHGASIGSGYGPVVVARESLTPDELNGHEIVVPGTMTTSFLALRLVLGAGGPAAGAGHVRWRGAHREPRSRAGARRLRARIRRACVPAC